MNKMKAIIAVNPKKDLQIALAPISADLNLIKWMMSALIVVAIASKARCKGNV